MIKKENIVFMDGIGVYGLRFNLHGNHYGNCHDNHGNPGNHHSSHGNHHDLVYRLYTIQATLNM